LIRYCEEQAEVNDVVLFRTELAVAPDFQLTDFFLEVELFFSDLENCGGPNGWKHNWKSYPEQAHFKSVQVVTYRLQHAAKGLCEYVPVAFAGYYNCLVALHVETAMLDLKFRQTQEADSISRFWFPKGFS
jgi:hypothetical protein